MKYKKRYREEENEETSIDISPLIDVVFILVIFFVVTTVFNKPVGVDVNKPPRVSSSKALDRSSVMLALTDQGQVFYGGRNIGFEGIANVIQTVQDGGDPVPVIVIMDANARGEPLTKVINAATEGGASSVSISTQNN